MVIGIAASVSIVSNPVPGRYDGGLMQEYFGTLALALDHHITLP
jgi:hypothetical protein